MNAISKAFVGRNRHEVVSSSLQYWRRLHIDLFARWNEQWPNYCITNEDPDEGGRVNVYNKRHSINTLRVSPGVISHSSYSGLSMINLSPCLSSISPIHHTTKEQIYTNNYIRLISTASKSESMVDARGSDATNKQNETVAKPELSSKQKIKRLFKKYGTVFVGTYLGIYITTLFSFFGLLESGFLDPDVMSQIFKVSKDFACETADVIGPAGTGASISEAATAYAQEVATEITKEKRSLVDIVSGYLPDKYASKLEQNPHLANLAVAWFIVKFTEPVRLAAAVVVVPKIAKMVIRKVPKEDVKL
jgi:hypothetical protein